MIGATLNLGMQGMHRSMAGINQSAHEVATAPVRSQHDLPISDMAKSFVDMKVYEHQFKASVKVVEAASEVMGTLIDTKA